MSLWQKKEEKLTFTGGKVCIYGNTGTGKSTLSGTFPRINLIDTEDGQTYYLHDNPNILNVLTTISASEVQTALDELNDEELLKEFDTVVIDSGTKLYDNMQLAAYEVAENRARNQKLAGKNIDLEDLNISQRDWGHIKRWNQQLVSSYILMSSLGKWTVTIARLKEITKEIGEGDKKKVIVVGDKPDLPKSADYDFDIILRTYTEQDSKTKEVKFFAEVKKDRTQVTKVGQILESPTFELWKNKWESTRKYGTKRNDISNSIQKDRKQFESEQENEDLVVNSFKALIKDTANDAEKKEILKRIKDKGIENPLKPKTKEEISFIEKLVAEYM